MNKGLEVTLKRQHLKFQLIFQKLITFVIFLNISELIASLSRWQTNLLETNQTTDSRKKKTVSATTEEEEGCKQTADDHTNMLMLAPQLF